MPLLTRLLSNFQAESLETTSHLYSDLHQMRSYMCERHSSGKGYDKNDFELAERKKVSWAWRNWLKKYSIRRILEGWRRRGATLTGNFSKDFLLLMISLIFYASKHSSEQSLRLSLQLRHNPAFSHFFNISNFYFFLFSFYFPVRHRIKALLVVLDDHIVAIPMAQR